MAANCANPLLLQWIKEWLDLAKLRNSKGVNTYKKAYESMNVCPITFTHPSEAQQLDGIGPKICDRLTEKLKEHCEANGLPPPKKRKRNRRNGEELLEGTLEDQMPEPTKRARKKTPYVPSLRSGAYALVLALSSIPEDSLQSLSKGELQILAQPHCDSSFTVPSEASKFYTAWSSMKTLLDKDLVQEKGRPTRRYYLSDEGWEVARRMKAVEAPGAGVIPNNRTIKDTNPKPKKKLQVPRARTKPTSGHHLDLDEDSNQEMNVSTTHTRHFVQSSERLTISPSQVGGQRLGAKPQDRYGTLSSSQEQEQKQYPTAKSCLVDLLSSPERDLPTRPFDVILSMETENRSMRKPSSMPSLNVSSHDPTSSVNQSAQTAAVNFSQASIPFSNFDPIHLEPGTFTVQLILDTREVRTLTDRDYIHDELVKNGIKPILRTLELGDFFWVAKMNDASMLARYGETDEHSDELALDWIVERKRLDDLVGSITDGRFFEQKFRLKKSGVKNVVYLIEEFSLSSEKETRFHEAIQSAIASTQVVSGYFVKKTQKLDETIRYISQITRMLKDLYETKPLCLIPTKAIKEDNYLPLLEHLHSNPSHAFRTYHLTYPTFASLSSKTENLTLRDVFMKMLMCTKGVSADKALALQKIFNTPCLLIEALEACPTERERDSLIADKMHNAIGRAKIKGALSQNIARIWGDG